jgi:hypothetical protein
MDQTVMSFAGTAARGSAIPTPTLGMYTHLEDSNPAPRLQFWNGSAWVSPLGATLLASQAFTTATSVTVDNVFSSAYVGYQIVVATTSHSTPTELTINLRVGGVDAITNYNNQFIQGTGTTVTGSFVVESSGRIGRLDTTGGISNTVITNVALAQRTYAVSNSYDSATVMRQHGMLHTTTTAYDGFKLSFSSGTGRVMVYGLRS